MDPSGLRPFAEVEKCIELLDRPDRAAWQRPDEVVTALALQGDACLQFNILHCEEPLRLLAEASRLVHPGGAVRVIHWLHDPATPREPNLEIRPRPVQIVGWAKETGLLEAEGPVIDLPPWHYGIQFHRPLIPTR